MAYMGSTSCSQLAFVHRSRSESGTKFNSNDKYDGTDHTAKSTYASNPLSPTFLVAVPSFQFPLPPHQGKLRIIRLPDAFRPITPLECFGLTEAFYRINTYNRYHGASFWIRRLVFRFNFDNTEYIFHKRSY